MKNIGKFIRNSFKINEIIREREALRLERDALKEGFQYVPPGHFFSPIPSIKDIKNKEELIFGNVSKYFLGIDLNEEEQLEYFQEFKLYYKDLPFREAKVADLRYYYENPAYAYSDGIILYCMIRKAKPKQIIEVGSGYSSCVMMDTNEIFFGDDIKITFIEPYPNLLFSLMKQKDKRKYETIPSNLQEIDLEKFDLLKENDILFIDSTHVSKINSDVNYIFFEILPKLNKGVHIHFHDIFYPFEYPKEWIYEGRAWNEIYLLRAFLQYNNSFKITFFNTFLEYFHKDKFEKDMPLCLRNIGGSLWIKKYD